MVIEATETVALSLVIVQGLRENKNKRDSVGKRLKSQIDDMEKVFLEELKRCEDQARTNMGEDLRRMLRVSNAFSQITLAGTPTPPNPFYLRRSRRL